MLVVAGGTLSATRASSRASSRSGMTSGTLEADASRRESRRAASRAGAARTAAILLISRHLKAVRDGGAHPPKCAAKGDPDDVCAPYMHGSVFGRRWPALAPPTPCVSLVLSSRDFLHFLLANMIWVSALISRTLAFVDKTMTILIN